MGNESRFTNMQNSNDTTYRSILVPLDGSDFAEQALPTALSLAHSHGAALHVVCVHLPVSGRYGEHAVRFAGRLPLPEAARVTVVHVVRPFAMMPGLFADPAEQFQLAVVEVQQQQEAAGAALLAEAKQRLEAAGRPAETALRVGDPTGEIAALAEGRQADLVIAGARGVSLVEGLLMGSVSDRLLKEAPCSVLIVR